MKTTANKSLVIAFVVVAFFLLFSGGAMSGEMMNGGGWMSERSWMRTPAVLTLVLGFALGWVIFKKKG